MTSRYLLLACGAATMLAAASGFAATFAVTTAADSGPGSLREAMALAEANGEADEITFTGDFTIALTSTLPAVTTAITVRGRGWERTIVDGGNPPGGTTGVRAFDVQPEGDLVLDGVMVRNCFAFSDGGAIRNSGGSLSVINSSLSANAVEAGYGGAIVMFQGTGSATLAIEGSAISGNTGGEGVVSTAAGGHLTINRSSFVGNTGGAVLVQFGAHAAIDNSTFSGNDVGLQLVSNSAPCILRGATFAASTAHSLHVRGAASTVTLEHVVLSGSPGDNCLLQEGGSTDSVANNLDDGDSCGLDPFTDLVNTDPLLAPLTGSGLVLTYEPLPGSPVVDRGSIDCGLPRDQRGVSRPIGDACDLGAVEAGGLFGDSLESGSLSAWTATAP